MGVAGSTASAGKNTIQPGCPRVAARPVDGATTAPGATTKASPRGQRDVTAVDAQDVLALLEVEEHEEVVGVRSPLRRVRSCTHPVIDPDGGQSGRSGEVDERDDPAAGTGHHAFQGTKESVMRAVIRLLLPLVGAGRVVVVPMTRAMTRKRTP